MGRSLEGKVALVTGSSRGIGRASAVRLASEGATVVVNHVGDAEVAAQVVAQISEAGGSAFARETDVSDSAAVKEMFLWMESDVGPTDILVNNAGVASHIPFVKLDLEEWNRILSVNLTGVFNCCKGAVPQMVEHGAGKIINIASELGLVGAVDLVHYSASKGGVIAMSKALARELSPLGINVNVVAPGPTETELLTNYPEEYNDETLAQIPLGRWGQPEDIAATVAFLASEDASFYAGWVLSPNGGVVM
jgi:3-oxoacyl-[acyl-carrier protein] reductase